MRYLFFDIECCNGRNICEFGYVITDDKFNILEKKILQLTQKTNLILQGDMMVEIYIFIILSQLIIEVINFHIFIKKLKS